MCPLYPPLRRLAWLLALALLPGLCTFAAGENKSAQGRKEANKNGKDDVKPGHAADCKLGTTLIWSDSVAEAVKAAKQRDKLLFVIHISGDFRDPEFT